VVWELLEKGERRSSIEISSIRHTVPAIAGENAKNNLFSAFRSPARRSGLGLEAQCEANARFAAAESFEIDAEFTELETAKGAAVVHGFGRPLPIEEVDVPRPGVNEVLVKIEAWEVCHTDLHAAEGGR
jgi:hypothetical protein